MIHAPATASIRSRSHTSPLAQPQKQTLNGPTSAPEITFTGQKMGIFGLGVFAVGLVGTISSIILAIKDAPKSVAARPVAQHLSEAHSKLTKHISLAYNNTNEVDEALRGYLHEMFQSASQNKQSELTTTAILNKLDASPILSTEEKKVVKDLALKASMTTSWADTGSLFDEYADKVLANHADAKTVSISKQAVKAFMQEHREDQEHLFSLLMVMWGSFALVAGGGSILSVAKD